MNARLSPRWAWLAFAIVLAIGAAGCGSGSLDKAGNPSSKPLVLTLADSNGDTSDAQPFAAAVWKASHGTLRIRIEGNWRPNDSYSETDLIKDVQAGKAVLGITASR